MTKWTYTLGLIENLIKANNDMSNDLLQAEERLFWYKRDLSEDDYVEAVTLMQNIMSNIPIESLETILAIIKKAHD